MARKTTKKTDFESEFENEIPEAYNEFETHDEVESLDVFDEPEAYNEFETHDEDLETEDTHDELVESDEDDEPLIVNGTVATRLNIRENDTGSPETAIVAIVEAGEEISVYPEEGNSTFFKVKTKNGVEGYAMRRYIILEVE